MSTSRKGLPGFFKCPPQLKALRKSIWETFNWLHQHSPVNFSSIWGNHHPAMEQVTGNPLIGRTAELGQPIIGLTANLTSLDEAAEQHPLKRAYCSVLNETTNYVKRPADIKQLLLFNDSKLDRGDILKPVKHMLPESIFTLPSNAKWQEKRSELLKWAFSEGSLKEFAGPMQTIIDEHLQQLKEQNIVPSIEDFFIELTLSVVSRTIMGTNAISKTANKALAKALDGVAKAELDPENNARMSFVDILKWLGYKEKEEAKEDKHAATKTTAFWDKIRAATGAKFTALLEYFHKRATAPMDAEKVSLEKVLEKHLFEPNFDATTGSSSFSAKPNVFQKDFAKEADQLKAFRSAMNDIAILLFAGHETTAKLEQFCLIYLAQHPEILAKLREEIDAHRPKDGAPWTRDNLRKLTYLDTILLEVLRLQPTFPMFIRMVKEKITLMNLPECNTQEEYDAAKAEYERAGRKDVVVFQPGENINFSPFFTQRDADLYDDPLTFNPDRHLAEDIPPFSLRYGEASKQDECKKDSVPNPDKEKKGFLFPFGVGRRQCPGQRFAMESAALSILSIVDKYDFSITETRMKELFQHDANANPFDTYFFISLRNKGEMGMTFTPRKKSYTPELLAGCLKNKKRFRDDSSSNAPDLRSRKP